MHRPRSRWRFSTVLIGMFAASVAVVVVAAVLATTPRQAQAERQPPELGSPTATLRSAGQASDELAAPVLALFEDGAGSSTVHPVDGPPVPVTVGRSGDGWVVVSGDGLRLGLEVELAPYGDAELVP